MLEPEVVFAKRKKRSTIPTDVEHWLTKKLFFKFAQKENKVNKAQTLWTSISVVIVLTKKTKHGKL